MTANRICSLLNIPYPVLAGGMTWVSEAVLAAAVSDAGGLGCIATGNMPGEILREEIQKYKKLSKKPFAVNLILLNPNLKECVEVVKQEKVHAITFGAGNCGPYIAELHEAGAKVIPVVNSVALAKRLERAGADAIVAEGQESGGHIGETSTLPLIPQMVDALDIPVVAAGGIGDGRTMAAAFVLGAEGVQLGTALVVADESRAHDNYKNAIVEAADRSTTVTGRKINKPVRALKNQLSLEFHKLEEANAPWEEIEGLAIGALRKAVMEGDIVRGSVMMGQIAGLVRKRAPVAEILSSMIEECNLSLEKAGATKITPFKAGANA